VLGRVSEVVRTAAGERYIPNFIENRIKFSAYVRNVAVIGADRPDLTAIVCIDLEGVGHWAEKRGISSTSYADLSQKPAVLDLVASVLVHVNQTQPAGLRIKRFINLHDADDGEITRTRKLRRNVVETNYDELIRALYADASSAKSVMFDAQIAYESGEKGVIRRSLSINQVGA
jgi:long-chain acyl-CoA synthetase